MNYIIVDDTILNIYENVKDNIIFNYHKNKKYLKKNKITNKYYYIYYFMYLKFPENYNLIDYWLRIKIIKLFNLHESIYNNNKKSFVIKKKFLNYHYILFKIFEMLNLNDYKYYLDMPNKKIINILNNYYNNFFIN